MDDSAAPVTAAVAPNNSAPPATPEDEAKLNAKWDDWLQVQLKQVWEDRQSSTDSFDKAMLTLSSGALGVSLAFIKDIVPLGQAAWVNLLLVSWFAFALCMTITVLSFLASTRALKQHEKNLREAHAEKKPCAPENFRLLKYCTWGAILFFLLGLGCTIVFATKNVGSLHRHEKQPEIIPEIRM